MGLLKAKRDGKLVAYRLDKAAVIVGSGEACNIRVPDAGLVTRHCQILKMENGYVLRDMSGDAGTFVNGKKVKEHLLSDRDLIQVGKERFTFSDTEGENTARVAVSVAPAAATPAAKTGATTRAVAAPSRSGNTGRITSPPAAVEPPRKTERVEPARTTARMAASPPPAVEAPGRSTQRVSKGTGKIQKATGRMETGGTKKITARTAAAMGYQTSRSSFAMPSTRKGKMIAAGGVLFILALGGTLYFIKAGQVNPEAIKERMAHQIKELQKLKPDQVIEIDNGYEAILAEHEQVQKYVMQMYSNIDREHKKVHQIASDLKKAMKDVNPFLSKYAQLKAKPEDYKAKVRELYDECKSLNDSFGGTTLGTKLTEIQTELKDFMEKNTEASWETLIVPLQGEVRALAKKGEFAEATKKLAEFGEKYKEKDNVELFKKLNEQREFLKRESKAHVNRVIVQAKKDLAAEGAKKDDIKKQLEAFLPGLEGFKEAQDILTPFIVTIK
jgi:pSer/pThr/pTyr-binding forkhead associated (FHA) protein